MIKLALTAAILVAPQIALAQEAKPCLSRTEAADFAVAMLPSFIEGLGRKCAAVLSPSAFLRTGSGALVQQLRAEAARRSEGANRAVMKILGSDVPEGVSSTTMVKFFEEGMTGEMVKDVKEKDCAAVDRLLGALAPLPAANFGSFIGAFLEVGVAGSDKSSPFAICEAQP
jgi:hypothetical protein